MGNTVDDVTGSPATYATCLALPRDFFGGDIPGDLGIEWTAENAGQVEPTLQKLIDNGINFYIVEKTAGLVRNKTVVTVVDSASDPKVVAGRKVWIKNADIKALVDSGIANVATLEGVGDFKAPTGKKAKTGQEAATNDTVALGQRTGG